MTSPKVSHRKVGQTLGQVIPAVNQLLANEQVTMQKVTALATIAEDCDRALAKRADQMRAEFRAFREMTFLQRVRWFFRGVNSG